jgi:hypothetical protein
LLPSGNIKRECAFRLFLTNTLAKIREEFKEICFERGAITNCAVGIFTAEYPTADETEEDDATNGIRLGKELQERGPVCRPGRELRFGAD